MKGTPHAGRRTLAEQIRKLELRAGDVLCLPADTTHEDAQALSRAIGPAGLNISCLLVLGDVHALDEHAMNAAGWYRR